MTTSNQLADTSPPPSYSSKRRLIQAWTEAELAAARARGPTGGRPPLANEEAKVLLAKMLHTEKTIRIADGCRGLVGQGNR